MKLSIVKVGLSGVCLAGVLLAAAPTAQAVAISDFLANNSNVAGLIKDAVPFGDADRVDYVNNLLGLGANVTAQVIGTETYWTGPTDYNGTVSYADSTQGTGVATISGYKFVIVKYDGPNGGAIVYALNGATITLAGNITDLGGINDGLGTTQSEWKGGISGWTAYGSTPDGGLTVAMLGSALVGIGILRRRFSKI